MRCYCIEIREKLSRKKEVYSEKQRRIQLTLATENHNESISIASYVYHQNLYTKEIETTSSCAKYRKIVTKENFVNEIFVSKYITLL